MTSKIQRTPSSEASAQPPAATAYAAGIEALLRQYVERMHETGAAPPVMEMQDRVSQLAKTLAGGESAVEPVYSRNEAPEPKMAQAAGWSGSLAAEDTHAQYQAYFDPAARSGRHSTRYAPQNSQAKNSEQANPVGHDDERHDMARGWLEKRFSELRQIIEASTGDNETRARNAAIEQRVEDILERLNAIQAQSAGGQGGDAVSRQLRHVAEHLEKQQNYNKAHGAALHHIGARLEKLDNTARLSVAAAENAGARAEAAVVDAARKSSRQTFEMTARHLTEALTQTAPAARFTAIESEVRALNQQSRETGQRTARAVEDVHFTLRQFLEHVAPPATVATQPRRAGLTVPVGDVPLRPQQPPSQSARSAIEPRPPAKEAPAPDQPHPNSYNPTFSSAKDDEYEQESSRRVRTGLVIGVLIMLAAGIVLLCINLIGSKPAFSRAGSGLTPVNIAVLNSTVTRAAWAPQAVAEKTVIEFDDEIGDPARQYRIGADYERGRNVRRDFAQAAIWYERAARNGHALAMHNLGVLRAKRGVNVVNYSDAAQWFEKAAWRGVVDSQYNLAVLLERGLGGPSDLTEAYRWYAIAAKAGDVESAGKIEFLRAKLSHKDLQNAEKFVQSWKPQA